MNSQEALTVFAQAAPQQPSLGDALFQMLPMMLMIFAIFYFVYQKPMQKEQEEHKKMASSLLKGDHLITIGGILGTVEEVHDSYVILRTGAAEEGRGANKGTLISIEKSSIRGKVKTEEEKS